MSSGPAVVAVFDSREEAEARISEMHRAGVDLLTLSIVGRGWGRDSQASGSAATETANRDAGTTTGIAEPTLAGAVWGSSWGIMLGSAYLVLPGIAPLVAAGPVVAFIALALESAVVLGGLTAIGSGLVGLGIPHEEVSQYEQALQADKYLVMVNGSASQVELARSFMTRPPATNPEVQMFSSGVVI